MTDARLVSFAERVRTLRAAFKEDMKTLREQIAESDLDPAAVVRLAAWMDKDETARVEQEAIDEQYRFLAGVLPEPAELPEDGQIAKAAALYADGMTVRAVAKEMGVSTGKAHKLKVLAAAFKDVHRAVNVNVNTHGADPETGELPREMTADDLGDMALLAKKPKPAPGDAFADIAKFTQMAARVSGLDPLQTMTPDEVWDRVGENPIKRSAA